MSKAKKIILLLFIVLFVSGCTKYKTYDKKAVTIDATGQRVVENILCKTDETENQYQKIKQEKETDLKNQLSNNEITEDEYSQKLEELDKTFNIDNVTYCSNFNVLSGDEGLWTTVFVKSLAWLIIKVGTITKNYGWSIIIVTILIRLVLYPLTQKTAMQSENMKQAQSKLKKLEEKYRNRNDRDSQMMKAQETMKIYKEYNISPMSGCIFALIQIPLFFAFYEALYRLPVVLEENFLGINLGLTPLNAFIQGHYYYIIFVILVVFATYYSFKLNSSMSTTTEQAQQMKMMSNISVVMISIASLTVSTGISLYWIFNSGFTILQNILVKRRKKNDHIA